MTSVRKFVRAALSAVSVTIAQSVLAAIVATRATSAVAANIIATLVATIPSFELNRRWVWGKEGRRSIGGELVPFLLVTAAGLGLSSLAVAVVSGYVKDFSPPTRTLSIQIASLSAFGTVWLLQFFLLDRVLFRTATPWARRAEGAGVRA